MEVISQDTVVFRAICHDSSLSGMSHPLEIYENYILPGGGGCFYLGHLPSDYRNAK